MPRRPPEGDRARGQVYEVTDVGPHGQGVVARRALAAQEEIFEEEALVSVRTFMILSGVVVLRRSKVERLYEAMTPEQQDAYRSLNHGFVAEVDMQYEALDAPQRDVNRSPSQSSAAEAEKREPEACSEGEPAANGVVDPPTPSSSLPLPPQQHRAIWDTNGFHFCAEADVSVNRWLHYLVFPSVWSVISGFIWTALFGGQMMRSTFGAGVLFFTMLGPISANLCFLGSQAIFPKAARLNHSCEPNVAWHVLGQQAILGGPPATGGGAGATDVTPRPRPTLALRARRPIKPREELTIDYIEDLAHMDPVERRKLLKAEYGFLCDCARCVRAECQAARAPPSTAEAEEVW